MRAIYADKHIPRVLLTKAITPFWPGFVWTPLSVARANELPDPPLPGPEWVRLRNQQCGICASDLSLLFVRADPSVAPAALPGLSRFWLGHEVVSTVAEVGPAVNLFRPGDRVVMGSYHQGPDCLSLGIHPPCRYCAGGDTRFCLNRSEPGPHGAGGGFGDGYVAHQSDLFPCPPALTADQAVMIEPLGVLVQAVLRRPPDPGDKVLVVGSGFIGLLALMVARAFQPDIEVTVLARYDHQAAMAEQLGAAHILRHPDYRAAARITGSRFFSAPLNRGTLTGGFDRVYDCVGDSRTLADSLRWTRPGGAIVLIGVHLSPMKRLDLTPVWFSHVDLVGSYMHGHSQWAGERRHDYEWVIDFMSQGKLDTAGLITHRFPLSDYKHAIRVASDKRGQSAIKVVFDCS